MRVSRLIVVVLVAVGAACAVPRMRLPSASRDLRYVLVGVTQEGRTVVRKVPLEEYVRVTALSEFAPASGEARLVERMLEVQSVVSRTYALAHLGRHAREGFDLCSSTHCQLFEASRLRTSKWAAASLEAGSQTRNVVLMYGNVAADALFHADCGGRTSAASAVWGGGGFPYLRSAIDGGPAGKAHDSWRYEITRAALMRALNGDGRTRIGDRLDSIEVLERDEAGRAVRVALHGRVDSVLRGEELRAVLSRSLGPRSVRSTWFSVDQHGPTFVFSGRGFGHGVGLCQAGALARLRAGENLRAVLKHYFPGTTLRTVPDTQSLVPGR
jgi:stage II sporulation protein D